MGSTVGDDSSRDTLVDLRDREVLLDELGQGTGLGVGEPQRLSLVLCGIDDIEGLRSEHGVGVSNRIRSGFVGLLERLSRDVDRVVRWDDDEYLLALPMTRGEGAAKLAERVRQEAAFAEHEGVAERVTASFGVAEREGDESPEQLVQRAADALRQARNQGGNQVVVALAPTMEMPALD